MEIPVIPIGNSKGFHLSKIIHEKYNIMDKVEFILEKGYMIIKPVSQPGKGREAAFKETNETKMTGFYKRNLC